MVRLIITPEGMNIPGSDVEVLARDTETTIQEYTVPAGIRFFLKKINVDGNASAKIKLYIDNAFQEATRTSWQDRKGLIEFGGETGLPVSSGSVIKVTVEHQGYESLTHVFRSNIYGGKIDECS